MLNDEAFCIFILVISASGLKESALNCLNYLKLDCFKQWIGADGIGDCDTPSFPIEVLAGRFVSLGEGR